ncbi:MAG: T9SS type A sorting domain-containing protein [Bacteroidota bacterium]|jgi:hypothetical protein
MKNRFRSKAPPGWRGAVLLPCLNLLFFLAGPTTCLVAQSSSPIEALDAPDYTLEILAIIRHEDHPGFGYWAAPLGDLNGDGYDDFAIASISDTTFIFLGGDPVDPEPDFFVLGGAEGLAAGDFNGDGKADIVTSTGTMYPILDPELRGKVRVYLNTGGMPPYSGEADRTIIGEPSTLNGHTSSPYHSGVFTADMNGDGNSDLLYLSRIRLDPVATGRMNLILGGAGVLTREPYQFLARPRGAFAIFAETYMTGDLNGDGCDELVLFGSDVDTMRNKRVYEMDVYLGNRAGVFGTPDITNRDDSAWVPAKQVSSISDLDGDGCGDIINGQTTTMFGAVHLFRGSPALTLHRSIWLSDSIPNQFPEFYVYPTLVSPIGDMNGDGYDDCIIGFRTKVVQTGIVYLVYPGGPLGDWKTATGAVGLIPERDRLSEGVFPAGDVNGDGYDDVLILGRPTILRYAPNNQAWIYRGSPRLRTGLTALPSTEVPALEAWPQPLPVGQTLQVRLHGADRGTLSLYDLLGRPLIRVPVNADPQSSVATLPTGELASGLYLLLFESAATQPQTKLITVF